MDRIAGYRIFVQVADLGSFIGAARSLGLPRATVSAAIAQLEQHLAVRLFHRTTRSVRLTSDGEQLLAQARQLIVDAEAIESRFQGRSRQVTGRLVIDAPSRIVRRLIVPALPGLLARHPQLRLFVGSSDRHVDLVQDGVDCALRVGEVRNSSLVQRPLGALAMVNCASPAYLRARGVPRHPQELSGNHRVVGYARDPSACGNEWDFTDAEGNLLGIEVPADVTVDNAESYLACCLAGLGLIQVPRFDVQYLLDQGRLVEVMPAHRSASLPISLVYPHRRHRTRALQAFQDWLQPLLLPMIEAGDGAAP